ncbi:carboxymuconolactone decarboxylase family protein [Aeromicrobium phragmitis]|uniref:Carboxymuconolactone decarboxylase family protein n=1 Tax=Aeromicrobium phragmitis TaxID=2478914 RepID=A0A3L8PMF2_9ACTN|nr:carboxymuconolactone decarboxylase family protein [Aeromicrobium phragmitis]RLV56440.1 carboxymuconolactone decarboxylase family protein [Aeromicrobium phragmitis]
MTPRIAPGRRRQLGLLNWGIARLLSRVAGVQDAHVFSTLGRARGLFRGWLHQSATMMPFGRLERFETELVILRVAALRESAYELDHHRRLGRRAGITDRQLELIGSDPRSSQWAPRHRALLAGTEELVTTKDLSDATWAELASYYTERELIEFVMLVGHYDALATTLRALRIERDRPRKR